jgi:hypothetical protein
VGSGSYVMRQMTLAPQPDASLGQDFAPINARSAD